MDKTMFNSIDGIETYYPYDFNNFGFILQLLKMQEGFKK